MAVLCRLNGEMIEARADWNQDRFRRLMQLHQTVVARVRRRWEGLYPQPPIALGTLRRRYHASIAGYLYTQNSKALLFLLAALLTIFG